MPDEQMTPTPTEHPQIDVQKEISRMRVLADLISKSYPGFAVYNSGGDELTGEHIFTEYADSDPEKTLWPGASGQRMRMKAGQRFELHVNYAVDGKGCTEVMVDIGGVIDVQVDGNAPLRLAPGTVISLPPGSSHMVLAVTDCVWVGITVPRDGGYPEAAYAPDRIEPGPASGVH